MTFVEFLSRRNISHRMGSNGKCHLNCMFCDDKKQRLCVSLTQGWGRCMHCDWRRRWAIVQILKHLNSDVRLEDGVYYTPSAPDPLFRLPDDFTPLWRDGLDELEMNALNYVLNRGITRTQVRRHRIGMCYTGLYRYRVIFPIYVDSHLRGLNARDFTGTQKPKYLLSKGEKYLYKFNPKAETVILSEGVIKSLRIARVTPGRNSAALLGHDLSPTQMDQLLDSACSNVIIYPDTDYVGLNGFFNIADQLTATTNIRVFIVHPVPGPADDLPLEELRSVFDKNVIEYRGSMRPNMTPLRDSALQRFI